MNLTFLQKWTAEKLIEIPSQMKRFLGKKDKQWEQGYCEGYKSCLEMIQCHLGDDVKNEQ